MTDKYFIDDKKVRLLCIMPPKLSAHRRDFDETKYILFLMKDNELLENYSEPVHNKKYLETKIKYYEGKMNHKCLR